MRARLAILLAGTVALGGCAYGYGDYGSYGGLSVGIGSGYGGYYDPYGYDGYGYGANPYGGYGNGYGYPSYYGWYGDYYYPGTGYYVYDRYRRPHTWSDSQQRYWTQQRERVQSADRNRPNARERTTVRENWSGFNRPQATQNNRRDDNRRNDNRDRRSDSTRPQ